MSGAGPKGGYLVVDLETVQDPRLPWDAAKSGFPPPPFHRVVSIGALWLRSDLRLERLGVVGREPGEPPDAPLDERVALQAFATFVERAQPTLVTFNGRRFDLPVLAHRCLAHGVPFPFYYQRGVRYRYSDEGHIDLADLLTDHGAAQMVSLDAAAHLVGLPGKLGVDGSKVQQLFDDGRHADIDAYCLQDVVQTTFLLLRVELLRGRVAPDAYRRAARELWDALWRDERARAVLEASDRARLLLEPDATTDRDEPPATGDEPGEASGEAHDVHPPDARDEVKEDLESPKPPAT